MKWLSDLRVRHAEARSQGMLAAIRPYLPPVNFITVHYAYFVLTSLLFALIFWGCGSPSAPRISFLDSLYHTMSAMTSTGMNTVNVSQMSTGQQVVLFLAMMLGSPVLVSLWTVLFRRRVFEKRFRAIVMAERERKLKSGSHVVLSDLLALPPRLRSLAKSKSKNASSNQLPGLGSRITAVQPHSPPSRATIASPRQAVEEEHDVEAARPATVSGHLAAAAHSPNANLALSPGGRSMRSVAFVEPLHPPRHDVADDARAERSSDIAGVRNFLQEKRKNVGRNGEFFDLTLKEREYLGGVEYRAVEVLVVTVAAYYILWQLLGAIALGAWLAVNAPEIPAVNQQNPWWAGIFLSISAFTNGGMTLLDAGMTAFQSGYYFVLIIVSLLTLAGSQASPVFLRFIIWTLSHLLKSSTEDDSYDVWKETFEFILQYPRRVYINMFPARPTWMLAAWLGAFLIIDWIMFFLLNLGNEAIERIPPGPRVMAGFFQSVSILSGGFTVVSPSTVYYGLQVLWLVKMYASAYPTSITVRGSNVYEERSLGIYAGDELEEGFSGDSDEKPTMLGENRGLFLAPEPMGGLHPPLTPMSATSRVSRLSLASRAGIGKIVDIGREGTAMLGRQVQRSMTAFQGVGVAPAMQRHSATPNGLHSTPFSQGGSNRISTAQGNPSLLSQHLRSQLSHDVWWIALALFVITIIETSHTRADPVTYSLFNIMFEVVSAYANNGISMGLPTASYSFSGGWHAGSKFVLILVMLRGRHRDLPVALDRAVKLPSIDLDEKEENDAEIRRAISRTPKLHQSASNWGSPGLYRVGSHWQVYS